MGFWDAMRQGQQGLGQNIQQALMGRKQKQQQDMMMRLRALGGIRAGQPRMDALGQIKEAGSVPDEYMDLFGMVGNVPAEVGDPLVMGEGEEAFVMGEGGQLERVGTNPKIKWVEDKDSRTMTGYDKTGKKVAGPLTYPDFRRQFVEGKGIYEETATGSNIDIEQIGETQEGEAGRLLTEAQTVGEKADTAQTRLKTVTLMDIHPLEMNRLKLQNDMLEKRMEALDDPATMKLGATNKSKLQETLKMIGLNRDLQKYYEANKDVLNGYIGSGLMKKWVRAISSEGEIFFAKDTPIEVATFIRKTKNFSDVLGRDRSGARISEEELALYRDIGGGDLSVRPEILLETIKNMRGSFEINIAAIYGSELPPSEVYKIADSIGGDTGDVGKMLEVGDLKDTSLDDLVKDIGDVRVKKEILQRALRGDANARKMARAHGLYGDDDAE